MYVDEIEEERVAEETSWASVKKADGNENGNGSGGRSDASFGHTIQASGTRVQLPYIEQGPAGSCEGLRSQCIPLLLPAIS